MTECMETCVVGTPCPHGMDCDHVGAGRMKSWWAYIPYVCEAGVVFPAATLEEAERIASDMLMGDVEWTLDMNPREFYMYELGSLHHCNFTEEEE